ncbi:MAG TPA: hypothetical protein VHK65_06485 [Candidatus Dormibacteraeota bacterium]|nr:hypothetical protein [Candidatus Dormibacteraeota bacterium]
MIWVTWAQHRREALVSGLILTVAAALLVLTGLIMLADFQSSGAASCAPAGGRAVGVFAAGTSCEPVVGAFFNRWLSLTQTALLALMTLPVLLGVFIAAPLLSREFEQRTHLFAWSQSITKLRWVLVKLGLFAAVVLVSAAALTVLVIWWHSPLDRAFYGGPWAAFDVEGLAPIGYAVFALSLGTLAGLVFRRTIPAMALTLFVFVGARILIAQVRPHFMTAVTGSALDVKQGSWLVSANYYTDAQGHHVSFEQVNQMVSVYASTAPKTFNGSAVMDYLHQQGISLLTDYQPPDRFWTFQLIEAALFFGLAISLIAASLWWLQRRA